MSNEHCVKNVQQEKESEENDVAKEMTIKRSSKDYYGRQNIKVIVGKEEIEIPEKIIEDFIKNKNIEETYIPIPD